MPDADAVPLPPSRPPACSRPQLVWHQLAHRLRAHFEWSNEVWNDQFGQARWALEQAGSLGLAADRYEARALFYSQRSQQVFTTVAAVFGGTQRIRRVMSYQAVVP